MNENKQSFIEASVPPGYAAMQDTEEGQTLYWYSFAKPSNRGWETRSGSLPFDSASERNRAAWRHWTSAVFRQVEKSTPESLWDGMEWHPSDDRDENMDPLYAKPHVTCGRYVWGTLWVDEYDEDGYYDGYETYEVRDTSQSGHPGFVTSQFVTTDLDESAAMFAVKVLQWQIGEFE